MAKMTTRRTTKENVELSDAELIEKYLGITYFSDGSWTDEAERLRAETLMEARREAGEKDARERAERTAADAEEYWRVREG
jgi:hypothetical protein